ncbi:unnamed protein product [Prorocentrum cordatum]|uniref:Uncharacterized protein n=1 Tax=Prorocentrum cordatum TaxID=2364126 RepID=A0ABN9WP65_9DINO|nr:unnamed protein product [Polarella glacialis]
MNDEDNERKMSTTEDEHECGETEGAERRVPSSMSMGLPLAHLEGIGQTIVNVNVAHRYADDPDPVQAAHGVSAYMWWGKPPDSQGRCVVKVCGYCQRWFTSNCRMIPGMIMTKFKAALGSDKDRIDRRAQIISKLVQSIIEAGDRKNLHVDFDQIHDCVLSRVKLSEKVKTTSGITFYPAESYMREFGNFPDNEKAKYGRYEGTDDGEDGIWVPNIKKTRYEQKDRDQSVLSRELGRAGADDADIVTKQKRLLNVLFPGVMNAMGLGAAIDDAQGRAPAGGGAAPAAAAAKKRGRPPSNNLLGETDDLERRFFAASQTDPLIWGSGQSMQLALIADMLKQLPTKIGALTTEAEIKTYKVAQKKLQIIADIMTLNEVGADALREKYRGGPQRYDVAVTAMALEPAVDLKAPAHLQWRRLKGDLERSGDDMTPAQFFQRISTPELKKIGLAPSAIAEEQEACIADCLKDVLKSKNDVPARKKLANLLSEDIVVDLVDEVAEWWASLDALFTAGTAPWGDIETMSAVVNDAVAVIDSSLPGKPKSTLLGSALTMWPVGKDVLAQGRLIATKAKATLASLAPLMSKAEIFSKAVERCVTDLAVTDLSWINRAADALMNLQADYQAALSGGIQIYIPEAKDTRFVEGTGKWLDLVAGGWVKILVAVVREDSYAADLRRWLHDTLEMRNILAMSSFYKASACEHAAGIANTLVKWDKLLLAVSPDTDVELSKFQNLQSLMVGCFKSFPHDLAPWTSLTLPSALLRAPTFVDGPRMDSGETYVNEIYDAAKQIFGETPKAFSCERLKMHDINFLMVIELPRKSVEGAARCAGRVSDEALRVQLNYLDSIVYAIGCAAKPHRLILLREETKSFKDLLLTDDHVTAWRGAGVRMGHLQRLVDDPASPGMMENILESPVHLDRLDGLLDVLSYGRSVIAESSRIETVFREFLASDVARMCETIDQKVPTFPSMGLLGNKKVIKQIIEAQHSTLSQVSAALKHELRLGKMIGKVFHVLPPEASARAGKAVECALATVAPGAVFTCAEVDWPAAEFEDVAARAKAVAKLRVELSKTGWAETPEIGQLLNQWRDGRCIGTRVLEQAPAAPSTDPDTQHELPESNLREGDDGDNRKKDFWAEDLAGGSPGPRPQELEDFVKAAPDA